MIPGLAVARVLADRGWKIVWIGTTTGMEKGLVERQGIEFHPLNFKAVSAALVDDYGRTQRRLRLSGCPQLLKNFVRRQQLSTCAGIVVPVCFAAQNLLLSH